MPVLSPAARLSSPAHQADDPADLLDELAARINAAHERAERARRRSEEANREAVSAAIEAGDGLNEAARAVEAGGWTAWVARNFNGSMRTSQLYRRLARRREEAQSVAHLGIGGADRALSTSRPFKRSRAEDIAVETGLGDRSMGFVAGCAALIAIKDRGLFRQTHAELEDYLERRWGLTPFWVLRLLRETGDAPLATGTSTLGEEEVVFEANRGDFITITDAWIADLSRGRRDHSPDRDTITSYGLPPTAYRSRLPTPGQMTLQSSGSIPAASRTVDRYEHGDPWPERRSRLVREAVARVLDVAAITDLAIALAPADDRAVLEADKMALAIEAQRHADRLIAP